MGLIKTGIMAGTGAYAANKFAKTYQATHQQQPQQQQQPYQQYQHSPSHSNSRSIAGHASYCNGSCGGQCMPAVAQDTYLHASYCNGACGSQCNQAGQPAPQYPGSARTIEDSSSPLPWDREKQQGYAPASHSHPSFQ